jgi:putative pyruvate formate lyase activating enzyme
MLVLHKISKNHELCGLAFIAHEISPNTYLNLMDQYRPCYRTEEYPPLGRTLKVEEYRAALAAERSGLHRLDRRLGESA